MTNKFEKGDLVVLKSGGPPMMVNEVPGENAENYPHKPRKNYRCVWFKGATGQHGDFNEHLLEEYVAPAK